ncbi:MAG: murein biosynthesis integral membrane protein MurJ [Kiritimatiellales bacterium]|nr:murein biosynthesis integral membrane protein MurJ [Kiritimatiellota bacterium]MBL7011596.1 murein biosynthesis integral membrane protein MurJ [Kiritimatiellales bacterium]
MEKGRIIRSTGVVSAFTSLSRLLGLVRDVLMAGFFGTSLVMSAFVVAFTIPNLFRRLFGEGALSSAFVPVLVETREKEGDEAAWTLVNRVLVLLAAVLTLITLAVILFAATASVANPKAAAVLELLQIMMPYMIFICLAAVSMGILNSFHHFAVSAFAPSLLNILWIGTMLLVVPNLGNSPEEKIRYVAWAILLAGFLQWAVQWPMLRRFGWAPRFPNLGSRLSLHPTILSGWRDEKVMRIMRLMGPAALGMAVLQLNVVIDRLLAMWVSKEAPAALFFSERLIYFPLGIIATALGTVLLPVFSGHAARNDHEKIRKGVTDGLRHLLFIMIPAAVGLLVLATPVVQMIFEWKEFSADSTWMTAIALQAYAPGLVVFSLAKIFVPAFYGMQDTKTPVKIGMIAVALNLALNIIFIVTLPQAVKHAGIAFATVLSAVFNMSCLALILQNRIGKPDWKKIGATAARSFGAAALMASVVLFVHGLTSSGQAAGDKIQQIVSVLVSIAAGSGVYLIASLIFRAPELREFTRALRR